MAAVRLLWTGFLLSPVLCDRHLGFHSDLHATGRGEGGGGFRLYSRGQIHDFLLLDSAEDFNVRLGSDGHLRVQPLTFSNPNATWWTGRPLLGMKVRQLSLNGSVTERALHAKVKAVEHLDQRLLKIDLEHDRNMDPVQSGVIQMQFSPPDLPMPAGRKDFGYLHDLLRGSEVMESTVHMQNDDVVLVAAAHKAEASILSGLEAKDVSWMDSADLVVELRDVQETHRVHPSLKIEVPEGEGTRGVCYTSWTTVQVAISGTLEVKAGSEIGVEKRHLVSSSPSRLLHRLPLALLPSHPSLHLVTSYSTATWLDVYVTTSRPLHFRGGYNASGNVVIESSMCDGRLPKTTLNFTGWSTVTLPSWGRTHAHSIFHVSLHNEVRYQSFLQWDGVPEPVKTLPALVLSIRPKVTMHSSVTSDAVCLQTGLRMDGQLRLEDRRRGGDLLSNGRGLNGPVFDGQLLHQCSTPCPMDTPIPSTVSMATACGVPSPPISRGDPLFHRLQAVLDDAVEFRGEEAASAWCGVPGQPCPPCQISSDQTFPCADRVMAPEAASLLSRLARLARVEWPQHKVVVEEAWDEPDELHPFGRHGNQSLHYEGRALQLTLSSEPETSELQRLAQLAICAGFPYADVTPSTVEVCTAASQPEEAKRYKRSLSSSSSVLHELRFQKFMENIEAEKLPPTPGLSPLTVGQSFPTGKSLEQVLGPPLEPGVTGEDVYQYLYNDVEFPSEDPSTSGCPLSESDDPKAWCRYRAMTPRMALRLHRLAALVRQQCAEIEKEKITTSPPAWLNELRESTRYAEEDEDIEKITHIFATSPELPPEEPREVSRTKRKAINVKRFSNIDFWANKTVNYEFHESVGEKEKEKIKKAMAEWEKFTCLTFVEDAKAEFRTLILYNYKGTSGCVSKIGRFTKPADKQGKPHYQWIHFDPRCFKHGAIVHEIGHTLGWFHEHMRPDSPQYITLDPAVRSNSSYKPLPPEFVNTYGVPYDYMSIMHYSNNSITTKDPLFRGEIGQRLGLSFMDIKLANLMYQCSDHCSAKTRLSCNGTYKYLDKNCTCWCSPPAGIPYDVTNPRRKCAVVKIEKTDDNNSTKDQQSGQALRLSLPTDSPLDGAVFSALAKQAGFDYVTRTALASVQVHVRSQEGFRARLVPFQDSSLLAVTAPSPDYDLPLGASRRRRDTAALLPEEVPLMDGHDSSLPLSAHYRVGDFAHPDHRFFRLDAVLLDCLEQAAEELDAPPRVEPGWGYRPASVNRVNQASRHREERGAFQEGRAVYLKPRTAGSDQEKLRKMAMVLVTTCTPLLLRINRKPGFGCHSDRLYLDVRIKTAEDVDQGRYAEVWDVDNPALYSGLATAVQDMATGGPAIAPTSESRACSEPLLGDLLAYFSFSISPVCVAFSSACQATLQRRTEVANNLTTDLNTVLGRVLSPSTVSTAVRECLVTHCGGCLGAGDVWKNKVRACVKLAKLFSEHASSPWGATRDKGAFVNPHHPHSTLHALACQHGSVCLENTQLYSLAMPVLYARYQPEPDKSRQELIFSGEDNASPLLEVIQQEFAYSVKGKVRVYVEREEDLGVLKDTLKVLMIHNAGVTDVEFHFPDQKILDRVLPRLQRHMEGWALRACPKWSRFAAAPFSTHVIAPSRRKRSAELSRERNDARRALHSWEMDWLSRV